jgi:hypothetical protein
MAGFGDYTTYSMLPCVFLFLQRPVNLFLMVVPFFFLFITKALHYLVEGFPVEGARGTRRQPFLLIFLRALSVWAGIGPRTCLASSWLHPPASAPRR